MRLSKLSKLFTRSAFLMVACLILLSSVLPVFADPDDEGGWIEVVCDPVPADYEGTITLDLRNMETNHEVSVVCLPGNDYVEREQLPYGKYEVMRVYTLDNFFYNAVCYINAFELTEDQKTAEEINISVTKYDIPEEMLGPYIPKEEGEEDVSSEDAEEEDIGAATEDSSEEVEVEAPADTSKDAEGEEPAAKEDPVEEDPAEEEAEEEPEDEEPEPVERETSTLKMLRNVVISLLFMVLFIAAVFGVVFFIRTRIADDD